MNSPDIAAAAVTLFFVMDPLGNIPLFNVLLSRFDPRRRARIVARELVFALIILMTLLYAGNSIFAFRTQPVVVEHCRRRAYSSCIARTIFPTRTAEDPGPTRAIHRPGGDADGRGA
jgi:multiple antibiotic resistance protein